MVVLSHLTRRSGFGLEQDKYLDIVLLPFLQLELRHQPPLRTFDNRRSSPVVQPDAHLLDCYSEQGRLRYCTTATPSHWDGRYHLLLPTSPCKGLNISKPIGSSFTEPLKSGLRDFPIIG